MSQMLERVAMAIFQSPIGNDPYAPTWDDLREKDKAAFRELARAAIEVMREPTEEMCMAAGLTQYSAGTYREMIAAALTPADG